MFKAACCVLAGAVVLWSATTAEAAKGKKKRPAKGPAARFAKLDVDKDGKLSRDEFTAAAKQDGKVKAAKRFSKIDANSDGYASLDELKAAIEKRKEKKT